MGFTVSRWYSPEDFKRREAVVMEKNNLHLVTPADSMSPVPLRRVVPRGSVRFAFWALRIYIVGMLILVAIGFSRGLH